MLAAIFTVIVAVPVVSSTLDRVMADSLRLAVHTVVSDDETLDGIPVALVTVTVSVGVVESSSTLFVDSVHDPAAFAIDHGTVLGSADPSDHV